MRFPTGKYGRQTMEFFPAPYRAPIRSFAALVFPWQNDHIVLANICDRGWCIPSGRVEAGETSAQAAVREAAEEAGLSLADVTYIGCYRMSEKGEVRWADVYVAEVTELGSITAPEESLGRRTVTIDELPEVYHLWTPLTEAVFRHSYDVLTRRRKLSG